MNLKLTENQKFLILGELIGTVGAFIGIEIATRSNDYQIKKELNSIEKCYEELLNKGGTEELWNSLYEQAVKVATFNSLLSDKVRERARIILKKVKERKGLTKMTV